MIRERLMWLRLWGWAGSPFVEAELVEAAKRQQWPLKLEPEKA
jgi:hypothetical protein